MSNAKTPKSEADSFDVSEKKWQIRSAQVAILVTLVGLAAGGIKYLYQRGDSLKAQAATAGVQAETAKRQSQKPFLEKQQSTCFDAVGIVGSLAAENEPGIIIEPREHAKALNQFWIHYHGILSVVENDKVEAAMDEKARREELSGLLANMRAEIGRSSGSLRIHPRGHAVLAILAHDVGRERDDGQVSAMTFARTSARRPCLVSSVG